MFCLFCCLENWFVFDMLFCLFACAVVFWFGFVAKSLWFRLLFNVIFRLFLLIKVSLCAGFVMLFILVWFIVIYWLARLSVVFCCYDGTAGLFYWIGLGNSVVFAVSSIIWVFEFIKFIVCSYLVLLMFVCLVVSALCCSLACNSVLVIYFVIMAVCGTVWL